MLITDSLATLETWALPPIDSDVYGTARWASLVFAHKRHQQLPPSSQCNRQQCSLRIFKLTLGAGTAPDFEPLISGRRRKKMFYYYYLEIGMGCWRSEQHVLWVCFFVLFFWGPSWLTLNKELIMKLNQPGYVTYSTQVSSTAPGPSVAEKIDIKSVLTMILLCWSMRENGPGLPSVVRSSLSYILGGILGPNSEFLYGSLSDIAGLQRNWNESSTSARVRVGLAAAQAYPGMKLRWTPMEVRSWDKIF